MAKNKRDAMLVIGVSKDAVREAREAIKMILTTPHIDNPTRLAALNTLSHLCSVNNTTVTDCTFTGRE
jgi:hypothetical protein